jgi:hypothetical protein
MPSAQRGNQGPTRDERFLETQTETRQFADELKSHLVFENNKFRRDNNAILRDTPDKAIVTGLLVSTKEPSVSIPIAFPVESLTSRSSAVFSLYEGESRKLTSNITFEFKATEKLTPEDLKSVNINPETAIVKDLYMKGNELIVNRPTHLRQPEEYELDNTLSQGGYVFINNGTAKYTDPKTGKESILNLRDCRLYKPQIHSLTKEN